MNKALETKSLEFKYPNGSAFHFPNFQLNENNEVLILGNSGVGKTTLLHILGGLLKPSAGEVWINNENVYSKSGGKLDQFRGENIGIVFQTAHFVQPLSVIENLNLTLKFSKRKFDSNRALELLTRLELQDKKLKKPSELSIGEQQRVSIARALMLNPKLILADEPTSALDDKNAEIVLDLLREEAKRSQSALVIVTHDSRLKSKIQNTIMLEEGMI
jgi:ABC-type lipoprotein export system ATPase subunit